MSIPKGAKTRGPKPKKNAHVVGDDWQNVAVKIPADIFAQLQKEAEKAETNVASLLRDAFWRMKKWTMPARNG